MSLRLSLDKLASHTHALEQRLAALSSSTPPAASASPTPTSAPASGPPLTKSDARAALGLGFTPSPGAGGGPGPPMAPVDLGRLKKEVEKVWRGEESRVLEMSRVLQAQAAGAGAGSSSSSAADQRRIGELERLVGALRDESAKQVRSHAVDQAGSSHPAGLDLSDACLAPPRHRPSAAGDDRKVPGAARADQGWGEEEAGRAGEGGGAAGGGGGPRGRGRRVMGRGSADEGDGRGSLTILTTDRRPSLPPCAVRTTGLEPCDRDGGAAHASATSEWALNQLWPCRALRHRRRRYGCVLLRSCRRRPMSARRSAPGEQRWSAAG